MLQLSSLIESRLRHTHWPTVVAVAKTIPDNLDWIVSKNRYQDGKLTLTTSVIWINPWGFKFYKRALPPSYHTSDKILFARVVLDCLLGFGLVEIPRHLPSKTNTQNHNCHSWQRVRFIYYEFLNMSGVPVYGSSTTDTIYLLVLASSGHCCSHSMSQVIIVSAL